MYFGVELGDAGALVELRRNEGHPEALELGLGPPERVLGVDGRAGDLGIGELEDDAVGFDAVTGFDMDDVDPAGGLGLDPTQALGHQRAVAADLAFETPTLDRADPDGVAVNRRCGGIEAGQGHGHHRDRDDAGGDHQPPVAAFLFDDAMSKNVHYQPSTGLTTQSACQL